VAAYKQAVDVTITAQEILVDFASYPTPKIAENSHNFRPLVWVMRTSARS
jgi:ribonucleoside-diphosphate reductase alpha chain